MGRGEARRQAHRDLGTLLVEARGDVDPRGCDRHAREHQQVLGRVCGRSRREHRGERLMRRLEDRLHEALEEVRDHAQTQRRWNSEQADER